MIGKSRTPGEIACATLMSAFDPDQKPAKRATEHEREGDPSLGGGYGDEWLQAVCSIDASKMKIMRERHHN